MIAPWRLVGLDRTGSTNADAADRARAGEPEGLVLAADEQTAGRGRLGRQWVSPPGSGLTFSVLLRPQVPADRLGWLPLLAGVCVVDVVVECTAVQVFLKWPNDVLTGRGKLAGLLAERVDGDAVVLGVGLNVTADPGQLPEGATSLGAEGVSVHPPDLLDALLASLWKNYGEWVASGGEPEPVRSRYRAVCRTIGATVAITLPGGEAVVGEAIDVDESGRLLVRGEGGVRPFAAGDVVHLRRGD